MITMLKNYFRKTINRTVASYLIIGTLPVVVFSLFYFYSLMKMEIYRHNDNILQVVTQTQISIDNRVRSLVNTTNHLSEQVLNQNLLNQSDRDIARQLTAYEDNLAFLRAAILYDKKNNIFFTSSGSIVGDQLYDHLGGGINLLTSDFYNTILTNNRSYISSIKRSYPEITADSDFVALYNPLPVYGNSSTATIVYLWNISLFMETVTDYIGEMECFFFVFDEYNKSVFKKASSDIIDSDKLSRMASSLSTVKGSGLLERKLDDSNFVVIRMVSEQLDYKYIIAIPYDHFYEPIYKKLILLSVLFLVIIAAMIGFALLGTYLQYKPIRLMLLRCGITELNVDNEFDAIVNRYKIIEGQKQTLLIQNRNGSEFMKESILIRLFNARLKSIDFHMQCANLSFDSDIFQVFCFSTEGLDSKTEYPSEFQWRYGNGYGVELPEENAFVILLNLSEKVSKNSDSNAVEDVVSYIREYLGGYRRCGIGEVVHGLALINTSFIQAITSMHKHGEKTNEMHNAARDLFLLSSSPIFIENLSRGNIDKVQELLNNHIQFYIEHSKPRNIILFFMSDAVNCFMRAIQDNNAQFDFSIEEQLAFSNAEDMSLKLRELADNVCNIINSHNKASRKQMNNNIINYINQNFNQQSLSLMMVADVFSVSKNTVSQIVKHETGLTYIQYVTNIRFSYIKKEIRTTDKSINEIATNAGYNNVASFTRKFREMEGVTPSQYREMSQL